MFCSNCGKQVSEKAFVCPDCGCLVNDNVNMRQPLRVNQNMPTTGRKDKVLKIFLIITFGLTCCALMMYLIAIGTMSSDVSVYASSYSNSISAYSYLWAGDTVYPGFVMSILGLGTGIVSFVFSFKTREAGLKMMGIFAFAFCLAIFGGGIGLMSLS